MKNWDSEDWLLFFCGASLFLIAIEFAVMAIIEKLT